MDLPQTSRRIRVMSTKTQTLPPRSKVKSQDKWDLGSLFKTDADWETAFNKWEEQIAGYAKFKGHLGDSAERAAGRR